MELIVERAAALDVGKDEVVACICVPDPGGAGRGRRRRRQEVRTYPTLTSSLEALADWLQAEGVTQVVMEATGQYWKPIWYVLEERGLELLLVNARHVKILPGRKTDVGDAAWLCELLRVRAAAGQLRAPAADPGAAGSCLLPQAAHPGPWCRVPAHPENLGGRWHQAGSRSPPEVLGVSGRAMLGALVAGDRDRKVLAELAKGKLRAKLPQLRQAPQGASASIMGCWSASPWRTWSTWSTWRPRSPASALVWTG